MVLESGDDVKEDILYSKHYKSLFSKSPNFESFHLLLLGLTIADHISLSQRVNPNTAHPNNGALNCKQQLIIVHVRTLNG